MTSSGVEGGVRVGDVLVASFRGRWRQLAGVVAWSLIEAVPGYLSGRLVAHAVDHGFLVHRPLVGLEWLSILGFTVFVGGWAARQVYPHLAALVEPFRDLLAALTVSSALRRSTASGGRPDKSAVARLTRQVEIAREAYASLIAVVLGFGVSTVSALIGLASLEPVALVFVLPPLAVGLAIFFGSVRRLATRQLDSIIADEGLSESTTQLMEARRDVLANGGEPIIESKVSHHIQAQASATRSLARLTAVRNLAVSIGGLVPVVVVLLAGPWMVRRGATAGAVLGVLTYLLSGVHPALQTLVRGLGPSGAWLFVSVRRLLDPATTADMNRAVEMSRSIALTPVSSSNRSPRPGGWPCDLRFCNVTFAYGSAPQPVIRDLDLYLPDGDHLAVVGPSGIGKSTLAGLVSGLLRPQSGQVLLGGRPVEQLPPEALATARVLVPEESYVFSAPLIDNLRYLRPAASLRQIEAAVDLLGARSLVERLGGYEAYVDPSVLSSGERQLAAVVRAYLSPGRLVLLDEATCHLDSTTEARVEQAFACRPGTLVVVAHRMSSALRAKRILVLDGQQAVLGTSEQLVETSELYRDLVGCWDSPGNGNGQVGMGREVGVSGLNGHTVKLANGTEVVPGTPIGTKDGRSRAALNGAKATLSDGNGSFG